MRQAICKLNTLAFVVLLACVVMPALARAADRANIEAFLQVTGFDVALDSIALAAETAPEMLGLEADAFNEDWRRLADQVFAPEIMRDRAVGLLEGTLSDDMLAHAAAFYASGLGQRLVEVENASHFADDEVKNSEGAVLLAALSEKNDPRVGYLERMNTAIDPEGFGAKALIEIQVRFLLAASYSGLIELRVDEGGLRAAFAENEAALRADLDASAMVSSAWVYRDFSNDDVLAYTQALEDPQMQLVYELMNAVHFEVMSNRFEVLAARMAKLHPGQEL